MNSQRIYKILSMYSFVFEYVQFFVCNYLIISDNEVGGDNVFLSVFLFIHTISPKVFNGFQRYFMERWAKEKLI